MTLDTLPDDIRQALRQGSLVPRVSIVYLCHDGKGHFLMHKRGQNTRDEQGVWDIGGGSLDFGKTVMETLREEIKEEYGTDVLLAELLGYRDVFREHEGKETHWLALDWKVLVDPAKAKNGEPHKFDEVGWFRLDNLPSPLHSQLMSLLVDKREELKEFGILPV